MNVAELPEKIHLEIVTPERVVVSEDVDSVNAPGALGEFGVLPGHTAMLTTLTIGRVSYQAGGRTTDLAIAWGYAEIGPEAIRPFDPGGTLCFNINTPADYARALALAAAGAAPLGSAV